MKKYYTYILASQKNGTLYIGVTSDLKKRTYEHKNNLAEGFTSEHNVKNLIWFEQYDDVENAIHREKRLKKYTRQAKIDLIEKENKDWKDLYNDLF